MARYEFFLASSLEKVFPAQRPAALSDGARLSVWRGARAAVQLVYRADDAAPGMPVQSFTIEADGAPAPAVLRAVELMPSDYPCYESADEHYITKEPGLFPDLLAPLEAPAVTPLPRQYRSVWLSWDIPADAAPGAYEVAVTARAVEEQRMPNGVLYRDADAAGLAFTCRFTLCVGRARLPAQTLLHTDAVQGFLKLPFQAKTLGADLISVSAHKVHGIKGAGALYIRPGLSLPPFVLGGGQESGLRSGTEGLPAIAAFAAACRAALPKRTESIARQRRLLAQAQELLRAIDGVQLLGAQEAPHILNLAVPGVRSQGLINALQERDIYVSAGSACSKGHRSHVLEAMGVDAAWIDGSVRVSLSDETTEDDIRALAEALPAVLTELRGGGRRA